MFKLDPLPYAMNAFEKLSEQSFNVHYGKHHANYVNNLNVLIKECAILQNKNLNEVMKISFENLKEKFYLNVFNNAAQHFNHSFFWKSLSPVQIFLSNDLQKKIEGDFGNMDLFYEKFIKTGLELFGSGWVWIVYNNITEKIEIHGMEKAGTAVLDYIPLLVCDVWEHAYYIDYLNNRKEFLSVVYEYFNWDFALQNYNLR